jgi:hypothetical protein
MSMAQGVIIGTSSGVEEGEWSSKNAKLFKKLYSTVKGYAVFSIAQEKNVYTH